MAINIRTLRTPTPEAGYALAVQLAQKGVVTTQPSERIRELLRPVYSTDADSLISVSRTIGVYYQIVAAANNYWRGRTGNSNTGTNRGNRSAVNGNKVRSAGNPGMRRTGTTTRRSGRNNRNRVAAGNSVRTARSCRRRRVAR